MNRGGLFGLQHFLYSPFYLCLLDVFNCQDLKLKCFTFTDKSKIVILHHETHLRRSQFGLFKSIY